jgi:hypothetical protein
VTGDDQIWVADSLDDRIRVVSPAGGVVLGGQVDSDRVVAALLQLGSHEVPVPGAPAPTVDEREGTQCR